MVDDEAVGRGPTTAPAPLRVPRAMGGVRWPPSRPRRRRPCLPGDGGACCTPRVRRAPVCVSRPGDVAPVTINGAHRRPPARLRPRPWGSRPVRVPRTPHHRPPLPPLGESARACAAHAASPPSAPAPGGVGRSRRGRPAGRDPALAPVRAARSGCRRRRTVRHPVPPRFAPPGRHGPGAEAGGATLVGACRGPAAAVRAGPDPSSRPRVTAVPAIAIRTPTAPGRASEREPHRNRHHARRRTPAPPNPRDRRVTHEIVT